MERNQKTVIVTGASQGIGAGVVQAFLARGYNVVGTSRSATKSKELSASDHLALIDGDIGLTTPNGKNRTLRPCRRRLERKQRCKT
jgi:NAD(P)-dependent dehydrogenase (short-subunit alcohol dehydrogenase family)